MVKVIKENEHALVIATDHGEVEMYMSDINSLIEELSKMRDYEAYKNKPMPTLSEMRASKGKCTCESFEEHIERRGFRDPIRTGGNTNG